MYFYLLSLPRPAKSALLLGLDLSAIAIAYVVAQMLRISTLWPAMTLERGLPALSVSLVTGLTLSLLFRVHVVKIAAFEPRDMLRLALWALGVTAATTLANLILPLGAPRTVPMIQGTVLIALLVVIRLGLLGTLLTLSVRATGSERVAIYGAGAAGLQMASALARSTEYRPVLLVDDDPRLHGMRMAGLQVVEPAYLERMVQRGPHRQDLRGHSLSRTGQAPGIAGPARRSRRPGGSAALLYRDGGRRRHRRQSASGRA